MPCVPNCQCAKSVATSSFYWPTCQWTCQRRASYSTWRANVPTCQRRAKFSTWWVNVQKGVPIFQLRLPKGISIFKLFFVFGFLNFSIMLNICKFLEYLGNSRKFISRNKEFQFWHLQNFIQKKPYQPKTFNFVFNEPSNYSASVKWSWIFFYLPNLIRRV